MRMALQLTKEVQSGISVTDAYHKILSVEGNKENLRLRVGVFKDKTSSDDGKPAAEYLGFNFSPSVEADSENFIKQGYAWLKTQTTPVDYTGATDV
jgi:hypothetical protein